jgi:hypothetical protein
LRFLARTSVAMAGIQCTPVYRMTNPNPANPWWFDESISLLKLPGLSFSTCPEISWLAEWGG